MKKDKPVFPHDCPACVYLGYYHSWWYHSIREQDASRVGPRYDLYVCAAGSRSVLARYGVEPHEYASGPVEVYAQDMDVFNTMTGKTRPNTNCPLREAYRRALDSGHLGALTDFDYAAAEREIARNLGISGEVDALLKIKRDPKSSDVKKRVAAARLFGLLYGKKWRNNEEE